MNHGTAVLMWSADLSQPARLATPFMLAQTAVAMDSAAELYFTAQCVELLLPSNSARLIGFGSEQLNLGAYLERAVQDGVKLYACSQAMHALNYRLTDLAPFVTGAGGLIQFMARSQERQWRTLVF
jgi:predicted peroxiredoxin